jgi:N-acetylmuramoyl-L-alanine amidase
MSHSILLADKVQKNLVRNTHLVDRTVKQAGFWVLYKVAMPSILVELGFLSNATEEEYMLKPASQDVMAVSIYNAFVEYRNALDGGSRKGLPMPNSTDTKETTADNKTVDTDVAPDPSQKKSVVDDAVASEPITTKVEDTPTTYVNVEKIQTKENEAVSSEPQKVNTTETTKTENEAAKPQTRIRFRVQIAATPENIAITDSRFSKVKDVRKFHEGKYWKYTCGNTTTLEEAQTLLKSVKTYFPDAFIIAFDGETKIPVSEAVNRINK